MLRTSMPKFNFLLCLFLFVACSSASKQKPNTEAEGLFNEAKDLVDSSRYILATEKLNQLRSKYPYSFYSTHAELLAADILFLQENYIEAAAAYILFRDFHPKHEKIPYVIWRIAESYYNQLPSTFDRDLSSGDEAVKYYEEVLAKYGQTEYADGSSQKIEKIRNMKREKDLYIADFYFRTKVYDSALYRYQYLLTVYDEENIKNLSMFRIAESSYLLKNYDECIEHSQKFMDSLSGQWKSEMENLQKKCESKKI